MLFFYPQAQAANAVVLLFDKRLEPFGKRLEPFE
jgi:hypothetical protein